MREILFRGKDVKENWHIGLLAKSGNGWYISNSAGKPLAYEVIPSTVGQYTGLTDMNGNKIFEGDILKRKHKELVNHSQKMTVNYIPYKACFSAVDIGGGNVTFISDYINNKYELEVIGNSHDNPELLKEAEQE